MKNKIMKSDKYGFYTFEFSEVLQSLTYSVNWNVDKVFFKLQLKKKLDDPISDCPESQISIFAF